MGLVAGYHGAQGAEQHRLPGKNLADAIVQVGGRPATRGVLGAIEFVCVFAQARVAATELIDQCPLAQRQQIDNVRAAADDDKEQLRREHQLAPCSRSRDACKCAKSLCRADGDRERGDRNAE